MGQCHDRVRVFPAGLPGFARLPVLLSPGDNTQSAAWTVLLHHKTRNKKRCPRRRTLGPSHPVAAFHRRCDPALALVERVNALLTEPEGARDWPLRFYSRERLFSVEARRAVILPDLAALPS